MPEKGGKSKGAGPATLRQWMAVAEAKIRRARLRFGHGTNNARDEAAFLILSTLGLPVDALEPWLDRRLTAAEGRAVTNIIDARITTRKPAPYLTNSAYIQGFKFFVDERVIVPRSFIGELLVLSGLGMVIDPANPPRRILDLCTGSGCLAILAALAFPESHVVAADISADALAVAKKNIAAYRLGRRITLTRADMFDGLQGVRFDLIISNPPYVREKAVAAFPPEYRAEPELAHFGGEDGLDLVHRILEDAPRHLTRSGALVVEIGSEKDTLEAARPELPYFWLDTETSEGEVFSLTAEDFQAAAAALRRKPRSTRPQPKAPK